MEVSAKYRGAFCEAKVTHVEKCVKCKVFIYNGGHTRGGQKVLSLTHLNER